MFSLQSIYCLKPFICLSTKVLKVRVGGLIKSKKLAFERARKTQRHLERQIRDQRKEEDEDTSPDGSPPQAVRYVLLYLFPIPLPNDLAFL